MLRLPDGMRERIKARAEQAGMSMNEAIVFVLERYFPAPATLDDRLSDITDLVAMLKNEAGDAYPPVDRLVDKLHETLNEIAESKLETPPNFRGELNNRLVDWEIERAKDAELDNPFADVDERSWAKDGEKPF